MEDIRQTAIRAFAAARGIAPEALDLDEPLEDDADGEVVEELCQATGLDPAMLFPAAASSGRSEIAVAGLRRLAPVSPRATERLEELRLRWEVPTVGSVIHSLEERRPVGSGRWVETQDRPIPPGATAARFAAWTLVPGVPVTVLAWAGCNPACRACPTLLEGAWFPGFGLPLAMVGGAHLLMLWAALRAMGRPPGAVAAAPP